MVERSQDLSKISHQSYNLTTLRKKYPDRVPIVFQCKGFEIKNAKYLVPTNINLASVMYRVRNQIKLKPYESLIYLVDGQVVLSGNDMAGDLQKNYARIDNVVYITVTREHVFG